MTVASPMVKGKMSKFYVLTVYSNSEIRSCLNACVLLRHETTAETVEFILAQGRARGKLGGVVDGP